MLLDVTGLDVRYGRNHAVKQLDLTLQHGEIVTVLGANGAGKSSLLKALLGVVKPSAGEIVFNGREIGRDTVPQRVASGLALVPEGRRILTSMSVNDNLLMGGWPRKDSLTADIDNIYQRFPNLARRRDMPASVLSGGEQQMLAISRALLAKPALMMLDEPSLGLSPILVSQLFKLLEELNRDGLTLLLVEQNTHMALQLASRGYVLDLGAVTLQGSSPELASEPRLQAAYLGDQP